MRTWSCAIGLAVIALAATGAAADPNPIRTEQALCSHSVLVRFGGTRTGSVAYFQRGPSIPTPAPDTLSALLGEGLKSSDGLIACTFRLEQARKDIYDFKTNRQRPAIIEGLTARCETGGTGVEFGSSCTVGIGWKVEDEGNGAMVCLGPAGQFRLGSFEKCDFGVSLVVMPPIEEPARRPVAKTRRK